MKNTQRSIQGVCRQLFPWSGALALLVLSISSSPAQTTTNDVASVPPAAVVPSAQPAAAPVAPHKKKSVMNLENADLRQVLQQMAKQSGMSIIIPDDIKGTVTARFEDKTIEQAMRTILEDKGYSLVELDGVYHIKSRDSINSEPTKTEIYQFTNASAKETKPTVDKLLTKVGNAQLDERSNLLVITDVPSNLAKVIPILKTLDSPTPQVIIETKLLETTLNPQLDLGVNWQSLSSYKVTLATPTAALTGSGADNTPSSHLTAGITRSGDPGAIGSSDSGRAGGILTPIGFAGYPFAAVLDAPAFSATFSFLLRDTDSDLLASPKVVTADNKEAKIRIATQEPIPNFTFNQQTASFVISGFEFKDVGNILTVTPHVNRDNFVTLDVVPEVSTSAANGRTFALPGGSVTIPLISIRTLSSRIMVKSGNTLALGGLLSSEASRSYTKVPFLGDIPILGELFRSKSFQKLKRNLLIFITPRVIGSGNQTGLEDQYSRLKETDEDARFAYKKNFVGNAKARDQFKTIDQIDKEETAVWPNRPHDPAKISTSEDLHPEAIEEPAPKINTEALVPVLSPGLR